ncbi:MAG: hypothetical protein DRJ59_03175 [Thermoprotei archaeon]|nr:MAG: hypothetical protein DRJ59_03175 [Thermoprotei archaeon]
MSSFRPLILILILLLQALIHSPCISSGREGSSIDSFKNYLLGLALDTWKFFVRYTNNETGLPYDRSTPGNPQTSITNIGLYMASVVAAYDLGFIDRNEALQRLKRTINSLIRLEKWHGIPFNWYNADTLNPIWGRFVSSVDAGWYAAGLIVARNAFPELYENLTRLIEMMEWDKLYDSSVKRLYVGYDSLRKRYTQGHYDYLAIESRTASLIAIGLGRIPAEHWAALSRDVQFYYNISFLWGWHAGLFIYYMPGIFIDERCSFIARSAINVTLAQILYAEEYAYPVWGFSPCDIPGGGYGMRFDVATPHASVLALIYFPEEVLLNLLKLEEMGVRSDYGFKDSVSLVSGRVDEDYLALDQGMILLTIANYLNGSVWRYFERDPIVIRAKSLISEYKVQEEILEVYRKVFEEDTNVVLENLLKGRLGFSALRTLRLAKLHFAAGNYEKALNYADKAVEEIGRVDENYLKDAISRLLERAKSSIASALRDGRTSMINKALRLYNGSVELFEQGCYTKAYAKAVIAKFYADISRRPVIRKEVKIVLSSDRRTHTYPCNVTLRGCVTPPIPANLVVERLVSGKWKAIAIIRASGNGSFSFKWSPEAGNHTVRVRFKGSKTYLPSSSNTIVITVLKGVREISLNYPEEVYSGEEVLISGKIVPAQELEELLISITEPGGNKSSEVISLREDGSFKVALKPMTAGSWKITIIVPETENYGELKREFTIKVKAKVELFSTKNILVLVLLSALALVLYIIYRRKPSLRIPQFGELPV